MMSLLQLGGLMFLLAFGCMLVNQQPATGRGKPAVPDKKAGDPITVMLHGFAQTKIELKDGFLFPWGSEPRNKASSIFHSVRFRERTPNNAMYQVVTGEKPTRSLDAEDFKRVTP